MLSAQLIHFLKKPNHKFRNSAKFEQKKNHFHSNEGHEHESGNGVFNIFIYKQNENNEEKNSMAFTLIELIRYCWYMPTMCICAHKQVDGVRKGEKTKLEFYVHLVEHTLTSRLTY